MVKQILFLQRIASNFDFFLTVKRPEFLRGHSAPVFEGTVEIGEIVKAACVADFRNAGGSVNQGPCSIAKAYVIDIRSQSLSRAGVKEAAEGGRAHSCDSGQGLERKGF